MNGLEENYTALILSIVSEVEPDQALSSIGFPVKCKQSITTIVRYDREYPRDIIASWYGISGEALAKRIQRYKGVMQR